VSVSPAKNVIIGLQRTSRRAVGFSGSGNGSPRLPEAAMHQGRPRQEGGPGGTLGSW
jgi:hypothetical protein